MTPHTPSLASTHKVLVFEPLDDGSTHLTSYGLGYKDTPEHREMMAYFVPANEGLYRKLVEQLEAAKPSTD